MTKSNMNNISNCKNRESSCTHKLSLKLLSGMTVVNVKPLFTYDSVNLIIACGSEIKIFTVKSGECIQTMRYHSRPIVGLQENKKNRLQIFSCSDDGVVVRWDYTGRMLEVYNLNMPVTRFYAPSPEEEWFVTKKYGDKFRLYSVTSKTNGGKHAHLIQKPVLPKENTIDFGPKDGYLASVYENNLTIYKFDSKSIIRHKTGDRNLTCVVCHPSECVVATGDDHGRVILWSNALHSNHPVRSIYHWHTLPVADLAFSPEGSHIYSGGGESVLIKWNLFSEEKAILPRLGAPIEGIISASDNSYVMTTHSDNVLQVINAQRNIVQVIQGLTRNQPLYQKVLPVGLLYDAHLKTLVMNGKAGHLQFFDLKQDKLMFNLDIASKNFISQNREVAVYNIDVQKAAFDCTGMWLTTSEYWCNENVSPQIWLKFWRYDLEKQMFTLNTNVYLPHNESLNCITFTSSEKHSVESPFLVTTSNDRCFKLWTLNTEPNEHEQSWACEFMGYYRNMIPGSASFCEDGSVLAVAFDRYATLWKVSGLSLKAVLFHKESERDIKQLMFGHHAGFKYLICHDGFSITVWDCVSLSIAWIVHYEVQFLAADIHSDNIAAFCKDQNLKIFKPDSPQPLDCIKKVSDSPIVSAVFVPSVASNSIKGCFSENSQLCFIDESQNLFTVTELNHEESATSAKRTLSQNVGETPFGMLQAAQTVSDVKAAKVEQFSISTENEKEIDIISNPTWQDPDVWLKAILPKLLLREKEAEPMETRTQKQDSSNDKEEAVKITLEENWMSNALKSLELTEIDFTFLTDKVKFSTDEVSQ